ncbi:hypothetical protein Tco_0735976 [Tanacetum coccineum]
MWNNSRRVNHKNFTNKMTHPHPKRSFVPQAVLTRSGKLSNAGAAVNTVTPVNTANIKAVNTVKQVNIAASKSIIQIYNGLDPQKSLILLFYVHGNPQQKEFKEKAVINPGT